MVEIGWWLYALGLLSAPLGIGVGLGSVLVIYLQQGVTRRLVWSTVLGLGLFVCGYGFAVIGVHLTGNWPS